ncbi:MAG: hypothetical protein ACRDHW_17480, partial [Ktedonobacteraceae bacterium]
MLQDQYSSTLTQGNAPTRSGFGTGRLRLVLILRYAIPGLGLALLLTCIEALLWLLNPAHLFGNTPVHTLTALFALFLSNPLVLFAFLAQVALSFWLARFVAIHLA